MTLRPATPADTPAILDLTRRTAVFKAFELDTLSDVLRDYHALNREWNHDTFVAEVAGAVVGFCYLAPAPMTDRAWDIWWLAVTPTSQGQGVGKRLLAHAESVARAECARLLLIETSSTPPYAAARAFYQNQGYHVAATVDDYYGDGDAKVIFARRLTPNMMA